ncbi:Multiple C2 and transmembrane domain-containing protein 2 [Turdus rufiventris]|nr:Multiple C2 and transmembrane domain-containing protein 2 [Turdus rufiventris]
MSLFVGDGVMKGSSFHHSHMLHLPNDSVKAKGSVDSDTVRCIGGYVPAFILFIVGIMKEENIGELLICDKTREDNDMGERWRGQCVAELRTNSFGTSNADLPPGDPGMYQLDVTLRRGQNLAARDRGGTSDPYVKFKLGRKEVFRSKTVYKNLNPVWEEKVYILIDNLREPLYIKVFDYDFGLQDDFIGSAFLDLNSLELNRQTDVTLSLKDPHYPDHDLGSIFLSVLLAPGDQREAVILSNLTNVITPFQTQSLRLSDLHRKSQLWRGIVSVTLIEGCELKAMDANGLSDPYVKFRLGHQKYKSKIVPKTLNPQWREQFDFHLYDERGGIIDMTVWDKDVGKKDDFMGRCQIDLSTLSKEQTHKLEVPLEEGEGYLVLLVTLTASAAVTISDLSINSLEDQKEREEILKRYSPMMMFHNISDVGFLQVKVIRAEALMAADVTGKDSFSFCDTEHHNKSKSDPFCVVELNNDRLLTHTVYRNLNPEWNKIFTFNIKDIHSVLEVTVYDEDRDRSADFLGKVAIPLLSIQNGEQKAYVLKNKQLTGPTKGVIYLEIDVIFNAVKASIRTLMPKEQKYIEEEDRLSKQLLLRNFIRMKHCIMALVTAVCYISSCFDWDSPPRSLAAFMLSLVSDNAANPLFLPTPTHKPTPPLSPKQRQPPPGTLSAKAGSRDYVSDLGSEPGKLCARQLRAVTGGVINQVSPFDWAKVSKPKSVDSGIAEEKVPPPSESPAFEQFIEPIFRFFLHLSDQAVHVSEGRMDIRSFRGQVHAAKSFKFLALMSV